MSGGHTFSQTFSSTWLKVARRCHRDAAFFGGSGVSNVDCVLRNTRNVRPSTDHGRPGRHDLHRRADGAMTRVVEVVVVDSCLPVAVLGCLDCQHRNSTKTVDASHASLSVHDAHSRVWSLPSFDETAERNTGSCLWIVSQSMSWRNPKNAIISAAPHHRDSMRDLAATRFCSSQTVDSIGAVMLL